MGLTVRILFEDYPDIRRFLMGHSGTENGPHLADGYGLVFEENPRFGVIFRRIDRAGNYGIPWFFHEVPGFEEFLKANYPELWI